MSNQTFRIFRPPSNISGTLFACVVGSRWFEIPCEKPIVRFGHSMAVLDGEIGVYGGFQSSVDKVAGKFEQIKIKDLP